MRLREPPMASRRANSRSRSVVRASSRPATLAQRNQQQQAHRAPQNQERVARRPQQPFERGPHVGAVDVPILIRILERDRYGNPIEPILRLRPSDSRREAGGRVEHPGAALARRRPLARQRGPGLHRPPRERKLEPGGRHADHDVGLAVDRDALADDRRIGGERRHPGVVAQNHDARTRLLFAGMNARPTAGSTPSVWKKSHDTICPRRRTGSPRPVSVRSVAR